MTTGTRRVGVSEDGQLSVFVTLLVVPLLLLIGLVIDGGAVLAAHQHATNDALEAARVGADSLNLADLRANGAIAVDPDAAVAAAQAFLAAAGRTGTVTVDGDRVTVTVHTQTHPSILAAAGLRTVTITGTATATPQEGP